MPKDFDPMGPPRRVFLYGKCCLGREKYPLILSYPAFFQIFTTKKEAPLSKNLLGIAERQGFEPWEQLPVHRISSAARSTTPASFP